MVFCRSPGCHQLLERAAHRVALSGLRPPTCPVQPRQHAAGPGPFDKLTGNSVTVLTYGCRDAISRGTARVLLRSHPGGPLAFFGCVLLELVARIETLGNQLEGMHHHQ